MDTLDKTSNSVYSKYWAGVFAMDKESVLKALATDEFKHLSNKDLCKLFKFLSCFFCCLDHCEPGPGPKPEPKPEPGPCPGYCPRYWPCYCPYFPCKPDKDKQLYKRRRLLQVDAAPLTFLFWVALTIDIEPEKIITKNDRKKAQLIPCPFYVHLCRI